LDDELAQVEKKVDYAVAKIYGLNEQEALDCTRSLAMLSGHFQDMEEE
jgi:hypothetical protein